MQPYVHVLNNPLQALERDNYQCVFTKRFSIKSRVDLEQTGAHLMHAMFTGADAVAW